MPPREAEAVAGKMLAAADQGRRRSRDYASGPRDSETGTPLRGLPTSRSRSIPPRIKG